MNWTTFFAIDFQEAQALAIIIAGEMVFASGLVEGIKRFVNRVSRRVLDARVCRGLAWLFSFGAAIPTLAATGAVPTTWVLGLAIAALGPQAHDAARTLASATDRANTRNT